MISMTRLTTLLALAGLACNANAASIDLGGRQIEIPIPDGFVELTPDMAPYYDTMSAYVGPNNVRFLTLQIIGCFKSRHVDVQNRDRSLVVHMGGPIHIQVEHLAGIRLQSSVERLFPDGSFRHRIIFYDGCTNEILYTGKGKLLVELS